LKQEGREKEFWRKLKEAVRSRQLTSRDLSLRNAFTHLVEDGRELLDTFSMGNGESVQLREAGVDTSAFVNITGQIVYSEVLDAFNDPQFIGDRLCRTVPTEFNGEKIPGIARLGDHAESVGEGKAYPTVGTSEEYIETPTTTKRGFIVPVTKEAIFFDRTALVMQRARETSQWLGINKEKRIIDAAIGTTSLYRRNGQAAIATYGDSSGNHDWDNLSASTGLLDYTDIEAVLLLFDAITDPNTGEPIMVNPNQIMVPTALKMTLAHILNATEFRKSTATAANITIGGNPLAGSDFETLSNQWVKARSSSATTWWMGAFQEAFAYMENWPITSVEAPPNSEMEFTNDIVARFKVSERGAVASIEPRKVAKATA
jgi:hypothetical protein